VSVFQGLPKVFKYPLSGTGKATNFNFCTHIFLALIEQNPIKNFGKSSRERTQGLSKIFRSPIYRAHRAVIFAVAQLPCSAAWTEWTALNVVDAVQAELLRITAQQVAQVCDTLEQVGDTPRLARFLWSLPTDVRSTAAFNQLEPVLKARAVIAYHSGEFHHLYRILTTYRFVAAEQNCS